MPAVFCMSVTQIIQIHSSKTTCAHLAFEKWELCPCLQSREGLRSSTHGLCQHPTCLWKSTKCIINPWVWEQSIWAVNWTATGRRAMESPWLVLGRRLSSPRPRCVPLRHFKTLFGLKDAFFLPVQKAPVPFFYVPLSWSPAEGTARCDPHPTRSRSWARSSSEGAGNSGSSTRYFRHPQAQVTEFYVASGFCHCLWGLNCDFSVTWPGACPSPWWDPALLRTAGCFCWIEPWIIYITFI